MIGITSRLRGPGRAMLASGFCLAVFLSARLHAQTIDSGKAEASVHGHSYRLSNREIGAEWTIDNEQLSGLTVTDRLHGRTLPLPKPFAVLLKATGVDTPENLRVAGEPKMRHLVPEPEASRYSDRLPGEEFDVTLAPENSDVRIAWSVVLRDGSNYVRQVVTISAGSHDLPVSRVQLLDAHLEGAHVVGSVKGSPIVAGDFFLGFEHPLSDSKVVGDRVVADISREVPLPAGQSVSYSSVIGVAAAGQMRRDFLRYVERERAHPYRTFLHYNSWYDIGYFTPYTQTEALDRINTFGRELHEKRGVTLDSFMFDDGWDDHVKLWNFNKDFPDGFTPEKEVAAKYGAAPGVWLSPWGGYGPPKKERLEAGKAAGYEIVDGGLALSGPKYYARFHEATLDLLQKYGVNQFKIDGTGNADSVVKGSAFDSDFSAAIHLIGDLRAVKPDLYINLTTGTYPSPFWLMYADSIWRGGWDDSTAGVGPYRERWITYRDADTYDEVVKAGPLYPLNSLMLHGMIYAQHHRELSKDPDNDFRNEIRSYFGTGTQLQEMYITPSLLTQANWDDLAEAAKWSRANADVLKDTHWVGGDPAWLEVYGWASWTPKKGILVLRNPSDKPQSIAIDIRKAFELPEGAAQNYAATRPWKDDAGKAAIPLRAGEPHTFQLAPFEVLTLDAVPD
jgi:hypothetical protein